MKRLLLAAFCWVPLGCSGDPKPEVVTPAKEERRERMLNLRRLADAMRAYHDAYGHYPAADRAAGTDNTVSWRVQILTFLDNTDSDETGMPKVFVLPGQPGQPGMTHYQVLVGPDTMFPPAKPGLTAAAVSKLVGADNAIMIVEAAEPVPWGSTQDLVYDENKPLPHLYPGGFCAAFPDGHVEFVPPGAAEGALRAIIGIAKQKPIKRNWLP